MKAAPLFLCPCGRRIFYAPKKTRGQKIGPHRKAPCGKPGEMPPVGKGLFRPALCGGGKEGRRTERQGGPPVEDTPCGGLGQGPRFMRLPFFRGKNRPCNSIERVNIPPKIKPCVGHVWKV